MAEKHNGIMRESLLQEGVSCARATLYAIEGADLFRDLPEGEGKERHGHATWLLAMLTDQLASIQQQVDALSGEPDAASGDH